ncbi:hypothetical protein BU26DRAFT_560100 [Trematosphaeria pertusa]|uniref:Heterokaryon incompatibility domain-containing protein n=1 Tax=Trematosphaeria pertusa TaxID=390896 RepID=A0A6A6IQA8_9PLEO|nr:uncharacterized protein BU26DRAFT_560100 [Trematosphaeria pertusa]KAF2252744.1 hypothetical protein BU26DRAFT_560100 [Trematosphaeria pertusa]
MSPNGTVGSEYEKIYNLAGTSNWQASVSNWYGALTVLSRHDERLSFLSRLSTAQAGSLRLLEEWWYLYDESTRSAIVSYDNFPLFKRLDPAAADYRYNKLLYTLWVWEFTTVYRNAKPDLVESRRTNLRYVRQTAAEAAAVHRTALAAYAYVKYGAAPSTSSDSSKIHPWVKARLEAHISARIAPFPFLGKTRPEKQYPYYLWDKREGRTVHFDANDEFPPYTVISHTWGRFRIPGKEVELPDRVPWPLPCLDPAYLFDVQDLPDILSRFPIPTRYIWFDLVCIPQDGRPLQAIEIGRQAGIFMAAKFAVVWLNQIRGWDGLRSAVAWAALEYLSQDRGDRYGIATELPRIRDAASQPSGLAIPARAEDEGTPECPWLFQDQDDKTVTPDRWFTSLWTLQEACLRPDMVLCDRDWTMFTIGGEDQVPILLDHLVALFERYGTPRHVPAAVHEIKVLLSSSSLWTLVELFPLDILTHGEMRYCADTNRAVAIMSALGVTDWYTRRSSVHVEQDPKDLVLGKYPLSFLRECHSRFGAAFFAYIDVAVLQEVFYEALSLDKSVIDDLKGSMMPFSTGFQHPKYLHDNCKFMHAEDHPAGLLHHVRIPTWMGAIAIGRRLKSI